MAATQTDNAQSEPDVDVAPPEGLQHQDEQLLDGIAHTMAVMAGVARKGFDALKRLVVRMDEFERDIE